MIGRRDFLKMGAVGASALLTKPLPAPTQWQIPDEQLGRVCVPEVNVRIRPDLESQVVTKLRGDTVMTLLREVIGSHPYRINQRWFETPEGYIWAGSVQPVKNIPNTPLSSLPETSLGPGIWVEVSVPFVDFTLENPPPRSYWLKENATPRLYYSQIMWVDEILPDPSTGATLYRLNEKYGYGDILLADGTAFRPLQEEELTPINPGVENKRVVVNLSDQTLSCMEGSTEVHFCRISSGAKFDVEGNPVKEWATPLGPHPIWRKLISTHMSGGTTGGGYDLPGIGWTTLFVGNGVAIHSTFWHNNFGVPMSHGCVNARPEDAKWIFRWTLPHVPYDPGDVTVPMPGGTQVEVIET